MLRKLQLDQTRTYELSVACNKSAEMLVAFIEGRRHVLSIGSEQGDIGSWDDLIIEHSDGMREHVQIKRQQTDFDNSPCVRDLYKQGKRVGQPRDLSPIDKSIEKLAEWTRKNNPSLSVPNRLFTIEVTDNQTTIKDGLEIRHLANFCQNVIKPGTTSNGLETLHRTGDTDTVNIYNYLTTWCGFVDWTHIFNAVKRLQIKITGNESDIDSSTERMLAQYYSQPKLTRQSILTFIDANTGYTSAITASPLLGHLANLAKAGLSTWTQYVKIGGEWAISGTSDVEQSSIENASKVVDALWNPSQQNNIKVNIPIIARDKLQHSIMRLIIHLPQMASAYVNNADRWQNNTSNCVGGTLGISEVDCMVLPLIDSTIFFPSADFRPLKSNVESIAEAQLLTDRMDSHTWIKICEFIDLNISKYESTELGNSIDIKWRQWKVLLDMDQAERTAICNQMIQLKAEGSDIYANLRFGGKTAKLLADGFLLLLVLSVVLGDAQGDWKMLKNGLTMETKAIKFWSGPAGSPRRARILTDNGIDSLLGCEPSKVLILSGIEASGTEVREESIAYASSNDNTLASSHKPSLIVTSSPKFNRLLNKGVISEIEAFLINEINKFA